MYHSSSSYGAASSAPNCNSSPRYGYSSVLPLAPSLYSEQDDAKLSQSHFESSSPSSGPEASGTHPFDYSDQYQQPQAQYYGQQAQQGLGILVSGGMTRNMSSSPDNNDGDDGHQQQQEQQQSSMKRSTSATGVLQTADDIHAVIGKDGKTLVYICPKCDPSKEFTTKSNLKRHLENKNIHNTPYERRRDQKRWQGHEKKQVSRDETTLRMRKWRNCNPEKNRFNDMRCRVYRNARKIYGDSYTEAKEEYIRSEIERRKQNMIIRNSRRAEWANQAVTSGSSVGESSPSPSASPISAANPGGLSFQMPETAFMFTNPYNVTSSLVSGQQIPAYSSADDDASPTQDYSKSEKQKPDESKFLQDLKENRLPPRRRSRSAMHTPAGNSAGASENTYSASTPIVSTSSAIFGSRGESPFGCLTSFENSLASDAFDYSASSLQQQTIRRRKQRCATENADILRHGNSFGYMDSNQQLQILEQKYNSGSIAQGQESLESVVEAMEINQAMRLVTNVGSATVAPTAHAGGLYGDRDASAWLTPSAAYHNLAGSTQPEDGSRGFPFPVIRDRKELARAAGIRLDIPNQHHLGPQHWISGISGTGSAALADDMVGGSATSLESSAISHHEYSPLADSPLSAGAIHEKGEGRSNGDEDGNAPNSSLRRYNSHTDGATGMAKLKGSNFEVFGMHSMAMPLYCQTLGSSESGFFATDATPMTETNYLVKDQGVARRHSTAMANLSSL
ncbi:hypothetical protein BGZ58_003102 [Dissophora ornata]|nr:hypothetical protein BGZ58_003102 [Dissophora ornata]